MSIQYQLSETEQKFLKKVEWKKGTVYETGLYIRRYIETPQVYKVTNGKKILTYIKKYKPCYCELITNKTQLYFDIDVKGPKEDKDKNQKLFEKTLEDLKKLELLKGKKCYVFNSSGLRKTKTKEYYKVSYRLIYPELLFKSGKDIKNYIEDVVYKTYPYTKETVDPKPYKVKGSAQLLRLPYCRKLMNKTYSAPLSPVKEKCKGLKAQDYFCSDFNKNKKVIEYKKVEQKKEKKEQKKKEIINNKDVKKYPDVEFKVLEKLVMAVAPKLCDEFEPWSQMGMILKNLSLGKSRREKNKYYDLFHEFSKVSKNYDEDACEKKIEQKYDESKKNNNIGWIINHAKKIMPKNEFNKLMGYEVEKKPVKDTYDLARKWAHQYVHNIGDVVDDMKNIYAVLQRGNKSKVMTVYGYEVEYSNPKAIEADLKNHIVFVPSEKVDKDGNVVYKVSNLGKIFSQYTYKMLVRDVVFRPTYNKLRPDLYNIWKGFIANKLKKYDESKLKRLLYHLKEVWANGDEKTYNYLLNWLAHIAQKPGTKTQAAVVLISRQGAGKNIIGNFLTDHVFGEHVALNLADLSKITERFNSSIENRILTICDEVTNIEGGARKYFKAFDKLKNMITEKKQIIEKKNIDPFKVCDYNNLLFFTNNWNPIRIESSDRRYCVLECSSKHKGQKKTYFKPLKDDLDKNGVETGNHFYTFLMNRDISDFDTQKDIPDTEIKNNIKLYQLNSQHKFLLSQSQLLEKQKLTIKDLMCCYSRWCETNDENALSKKQLTAIFCRLGFKNKQTKVNGKNKRLFNFKGLIEEINKEYKIPRELIEEKFETVDVFKKQKAQESKFIDDSDDDTIFK
jgi:hypothetical protein